MRVTKAVVLLVIILILGVFLMGSLTNDVSQDEGYMSRLVSEVLGGVLIVLLVNFDLAAVTWHSINVIMESVDLYCKSFSYLTLWSGISVFSAFCGIGIIGGPLVVPPQSWSGVGWDCIIFILTGMIFLCMIRRFWGRTSRLLALLVIILMVEQFILAAKVRLTLNQNPTGSGSSPFCLLDSFECGNLRVIPEPAAFAYSARSLDSNVIVLSSGLMKYPQNALNGVLAHEMGHLVNFDGILIAALEGIFKFLGVILAEVIIDRPVIFTLFGFDTEPIAGAFVLGTLGVSIFRGIITPLERLLHRHMERKADLYALENGFGSQLAQYLNGIDPNRKMKKSLDYYMRAAHPLAIERITVLLGNC